MRLHLAELSQSESDTMHEAVLRLLSEYGVLFEHADACAMLVKAGNRMGDDGRVRLTPRFVESMLALTPAEGFVMYGRDESKQLRVAVDALSFRPSTGAPFIYDYVSGKRRAATLQDVPALVLLADALPGYDMVHNIITPADAPAGIANIKGFVLAHRYSGKPSDQTVMTAQEVRAIGQIARVIRGGEQALRDRPLTLIDVAMISPLRCAEEQVEAFIECARLGLPVEILTSPARGISAPITISGAVAVAMAETVAMLCLLYLVAPGLGVVNTARIQPVNMRTAAINSGSPEYGMASVLTATCSARYNLPTNLYGFGTAAHAPGVQATMEKALSGLLMALGRAHMITGGGIVADALTTSPEQLVIDDQMIRFIKRICTPIAVDVDAIGIDALLTGMAGSGVMLAEEHTLKYMRKGEVLSDSLGQWISYDQWLNNGEPDMLDCAHERVESLLASHSVRPFDPDQDRQIDRIVDEFAKGEVK